MRNSLRKNPSGTRPAAAFPGRFALALFAVALAALPAPGASLAAEPAGGQLAQGENGAPGNLNAQAIGEFTPGLPIEIVLLDDSDENLAIRDSLAEALARHGHLVAAQGPLELTFETEVVEPGIEPVRPTLGSIRSSNEAEVGNQGSKRGVEAEVNVWSSTKDSLLGGRQDKETTSAHARYHINVQLRDREDGKVIWQGDAICEMLSGDQQRLTDAMTEPLAAALGRTVAGQSFDIR